MICPKCGYDNPEGSAFCMKCGQNLKEESTNVSAEASSEETNPTPEVAPVVEQPSAVQATPVAKSNRNYKESAVNFLKVIFNFLKKPIKTFNEEGDKFVNPKNSMILTGIVTGFMMIIHLLTTIFATVVVKSYSYKDAKYITEIKFDNLKDYDWLTHVVKYFVGYVAVIACIALIYYIISLMFKKNTNYFKLLAITSLSVIPSVLCSMILAPILGNIHYYIAILLNIIGLIYSILIFINIINDYIEFDNKDMRIYYNLVCITLVLFTGYIVIEKLLADILVSSVTGSLFGSGSSSSSYSSLFN